MLRASLYFHTLRFLRLQQLLGRVRFRLSRPTVPLAPPPRQAAVKGRWVVPTGRRPSLIGPSTFRFLNRERRLVFPQGWRQDEERLWLYNLHYFDDLTAADASARTAWHRELIAAWIRDNPVAAAPGWEPYPLSLRAVNWMKWHLAGGELDQSAIASLATQARYLRRRMEWHLLANHLFANAKALCFAGLFFDGTEADDCLEFGARIVQEQLREQVLPDGGHFERSPMYHALTLEDVLDLINALNAFSERAFRGKEALADDLRRAAGRMLRWLEVMTHPDEDIAFFNDAALGVALPASTLRRYAAALGVVRTQGSVAAADLPASGYARLQVGEWCALFDAAAVGPDYQPGHAHADTLSFELSLGRERLISNAGTSTYEQGVQRTYERSTRAHNTVEVDGENSSEVWASFRVARRARSMDRSVHIGEGQAAASCAHDGYTRLRGRPVHSRAVEVTEAGVRWTDRVKGYGGHRARGFIPLHPGIRPSVDGTKATLTISGGRQLALESEGISGFSVEEGSYAREFGLREPRRVLVWELEGTLPLQASFSLRRAPG